MGFCVGCEVSWEVCGFAERSARATKWCFSEVCPYVCGVIVSAVFAKWGVIAVDEVCVSFFGKGV